MTGATVAWISVSVELAEALDRSVEQARDAGSVVLVQHTAGQHQGNGRGVHKT